MRRILFMISGGVFFIVVVMMALAYFENPASIGATPKPTIAITPKPTEVPIEIVEGVYDGANPITDEELSKINDLEIRNVEDLKFLKELTHLVNLRVSDEYYDTVSGDIVDLGELVNLKVVDLRYANISGDIESLEKLVNLEHVDMAAYMPSIEY